MDPTEKAVGIVVTAVVGEALIAAVTALAVIVL